MCYLVEDEMSSYIRATGAQIDVAQFLEVLGERFRNASIKIPRSQEILSDRQTPYCENEVLAA